MKILIVARSSTDAVAFAELNEISDYLVGESVSTIDDVADVTAVFVGGWRERADALAMVTAVNMAELRGVKIIEVRPDDLLINWLPSLYIWQSLTGEP